MACARVVKNVDKEVVGIGVVVCVVGRGVVASARVEKNVVTRVVVKGLRVGVAEEGAIVVFNA